jgi:regulator of sirC expression with transglutaminase-like and TPR domain
MNHLRYILEEDPEKGRLDRAALELATIQFPDLDPEPSLLRLNELASQLGDRLRNFNDGRDFVETAQKFLFEELGFHGNDTDFFDPRNSCLNEVLTRRTGIAITLSLLYMEVGRRLHMPLFGIGLPRHFVVQYDDGNYNTFIDPYGGRPITARDCFALAQTQVFDPSILARVSKKQIVMRMLHNLRHVYLRTNDFERAVTTMDWLIVGYPEAGAYKSRGALQLELKRYQAARRDLEKYLELEPEAADRGDIQRSLQKIHEWLARVN